MTLDEYKHKKTEFEHALCDLISELHQRFRDETGLSAQRIDVTMTAINTIGNALPKYIVSGVRVDVPF